MQLQFVVLITTTSARYVNKNKESNFELLLEKYQQFSNTLAYV